MPKPYYQLFSAAILMGLLISCSNRKKEEKKILESLQSSFKSANTVITHSTETILKSLEEKTMEPRSMEKARLWFPIAHEITSRGQKLYDQLEMEKSKESLTKEDITNIYLKTDQYYNAVLSIDRDIKETFGKPVSSFHVFANPLYIDGIGQKRSLTEDRPKPYRDAILSALQNEIKKLENEIVAYCHQRSTVNFCGFEVFSTLIAQSSKTLAPGEMLEIKAGIGSFRKANSVVIINGRKLEIQDEGYSLFRIKVPEVPGEYSIPVKMNFYNQTTGKDEEIATNVKYTVTQPCNE